MTPAVELADVTCTFVSREDRTQRYTAVADVTLAVAPGEFVSVVGPTGCGKSTLLNVAAGLLEPSRGTVRIFGEALTGINRRAGYMFQAEALMPWRTALANVTAGLEFRGVPAAEARRQGEQWLRRRTSLAQTLVLDPDIILMDEPFSALDVQTRQLMENELLELWGGAGATLAPPGGGREASGGVDGRKAVLFITHDLDEAIALSDRVVVLSAGPASRPMGEFVIDLPRPRDVAEVRVTPRFIDLHKAEVRVTPRFIDLHKAIWDVLREEVLKGYAQQKRAA